MFATCLFCNKPLGKNETFETFPIGKRLAFDAAKGRLWVICPQCERWNLTPLEERWEVIEHAEQLYRDTRRRVSTDNIGLAKLRDGTELVRIGEPLRLEFAAWRYGDQFGRRRRRQLLIAGGGVAAIGAVVVGGAVVGVGISSFSWMIFQSAQSLVNGRPDTVVAKINTESRGVVHVRRRHLAETSLGRTDGGELAIDLRFKKGQARFVGREAERIASIVIPNVNRFGGDKRSVSEAVREIELAQGPEGYLEKLSRISTGYTLTKYSGRRRGSRSLSGGLFGLPTAHRLALEMSLHEEAERRALDGELSMLERAWRDAEEIAGISDDLLTPPTVDAAFEQLREKGVP